MEFCHRHFAIGAGSRPGRSWSGRLFFDLCRPLVRQLLRQRQLRGLVDGLKTLTMGGAWMLVLSRKIGEEIVINDEVRVRIIGVQGHRVRLGITAPLTVSIHREEIHRPRREFEAVSAPAEIQ